MGDAWSKDDANLTSALVISLSASSKTGRSFAWHLSKRANGTGPLGLLQVSSIPDAISNAAETMRLGFPQKSVSYTDLENTISSNWLTDLKAEKIVIFDFGARDGVLEMLADTLYSHPTLMGSRVVILQVGSEQKVYSSTELAESQAAFKKLSKIQESR
ncbi:hypothetical protein M7I_5595 [Glarea lozoyensis 74030]|uniref:Uncharacterized protein n=1 Tax=Glarea lozoyensis (strain ATCC 74030 / MF5533) TaxID=1104152 RepID=H0ESB6_GLAL7|nr:hypothetical protein M7I_5595 [Glarea lozoyensis 74030]